MVVDERNVAPDPDGDTGDASGVPCAESHGTIALAGIGLLAVVVLVTATAFSLTILAGPRHRPCRAMPGGPDAIQTLSIEQASNLATIVTVGQRMRLPSYGWLVAIATALRESDLVNTTEGAGDDALGLFAQRPSQGWGTPEQITDPEYAAGAFYEALQRVNRWRIMGVAQVSRAAQARAPQPSASASGNPRAGTGAWTAAHPDASADEQVVKRAESLVAAFTGGNATDDPTCDRVKISTSGWTRPVPGTVISHFRTSNLPNHQGIDFDAARYTVIRAASEGTIVTAECNISGRFYPVEYTPSPCDTDGNPKLGGCGWYLEIRHPDDVVTRYCHMVRAPAVAIGQTVSAGQPIGLAGTSGNSSATHLHFEVHTAYPAVPGNATEPIAFLAEQGVVVCPECATSAGTPHAS